MIAEVIVDVLSGEVDKIFDYIIPNNLNVVAGHQVIVPFGNRKIEGFVLQIKKSTNVPQDKLKEIIAIASKKPVILPELMGLIDEMKTNYHLRYVDIIRLIVPTQIRDRSVQAKIIKYYYLADDSIVQNCLQNLRKNAKNIPLLISHLQKIGKDTSANLNKKFSYSAVSKLVQEGVLLEKQKRVRRQSFVVKKEDKVVQLTAMQKSAVHKVVGAKHDVFLLHGVTGSGKTEVYMHIITQMLNQNKTAIMLVPEISLTPQMVGLFTSRFGDDIAVLHSKLSMGEKFDEWHRIYEGKAKIVIGARSAIFAPLQNVGVIIIDEEHDNSYLSDSNPRYSAVEVAEMRAQANNCPLLLGSATPNVESYYKTKIGQHKLIELPHRVNNKEMPKIEIVDMKEQFQLGHAPFSVPLIERLQAVVEEEKQAIVFLNRRGFSTFLMCMKCGYIPKCEGCDFSLVYHKQYNELKCHYCGKRYKTINTCEVCGSKSFKTGNAGTQQICEQLSKKFPAVPIFRFDNDSTSTKDAHAKILSEFGKAKPSILVGTQMIAKGHDFPEVSLVGIIDADLSLFFNDFRSSEKTFQLITQVSGRAGRSEVEGHVILQTYFPKHYVYMLASNYDYKKFFDKEINLRQTTLFPPFSKIIRVLIASKDDDWAKEVTHQCFIKLKNLRIENLKDFYFLEAMKSPITKIKNKFRYQIVTKYKKSKEKEITDKIFEIVNDLPKRNVQIFIETNPQSMS